MASSSTATGSGRSLTPSTQSHPQGCTVPPRPTTSMAGSLTTTSRHGWERRSTPSIQQLNRTRSRDPGWLTAELSYGLPIHLIRLGGTLARGWLFPASECPPPMRRRLLSHSPRRELRRAERGVGPRRTGSAELRPSLDARHTERRSPRRRPAGLGHRPGHGGHDLLSGRFGGF